MRTWPLVTLCLVGCSGTGPDSTLSTPSSYEGDDPDECTDTIDNDRDGYFDCQDNGCWGHPDCFGPGFDGPGTAGAAGTGAGAGAGAGSGTGTGGLSGCPGDPMCDLDTASVTMRFDFNFYELSESLGICDCYVEFTGEGTLATADEVDNASGRVTFEGSWRRIDDNPRPIDTANPPTTYNPFINCNPTTGTGTTNFSTSDTASTSTTSTSDTASRYTDTGLMGPPIGGTGTSDPPFSAEYSCEAWLADTIWWDKTNQQSYHSFFFANFSWPPDQVKDWVVHQYPGAWDPVDASDAFNSKQFYVTDMWVPYDHASTTPASVFWGRESDPYGAFYLDTTVVMGFTK